MNKNKGDELKNMEAMVELELSEKGSDGQILLDYFRDNPSHAHIYIESLTLKIQMIALVMDRLVSERFEKGGDQE